MPPSRWGGIIAGIHLAGSNDGEPAGRREEVNTNANVERRSLTSTTPRGRREEPPPTSAPAEPSANVGVDPPANYDNHNANLAYPGSSNTNAPVAQGRVIVNDTFPVAPGRFNFYRFSVGEGGATVTGNFRASGGRNDIQALLVSAFEMENFKNGHQFRSYYNSGWVTVGNIYVRLPVGDY